MPTFSIKSNLVKVIVRINSIHFGVNSIKRKKKRRFPSENFYFFS